MHHLWETNYITSFPGKKGQRPGTLPFVPQTQNVTETWQKFANFQLGKWMIDKWQFMFKNMSWEFMMFMTFMKQFNVMWWFIILNEDIYIKKNTRTGAWPLTTQWLWLPPSLLPWPQHFVLPPSPPPSLASLQWLCPRRRSCRPPPDPRWQGKGRRGTRWSSRPPACGEVAMAKVVITC